MGTWSTGCNATGGNCLYKARWMVLGDVNSVFFAVEARTPGWVGIGFSENNMMVCNILTPPNVSIGSHYSEAIYLK